MNILESYSRRKNYFKIVSSHPFNTTPLTPPPPRTTHTHTNTMVITGQTLTISSLTTPSLDKSAARHLGTISIMGIHSLRLFCSFTCPIESHLVIWLNNIYWDFFWVLVLSLTYFSFLSYKSFLTFKEVKRQDSKSCIFVTADNSPVM